MDLHKTRILHDIYTDGQSCRLEALLLEDLSHWTQVSHVSDVWGIKLEQTTPVLMEIISDIDIVYVFPYCNS